MRAPYTEIAEDILPSPTIRGLAALLAVTVPLWPAGFSRMAEAASVDLAPHRAVYTMSLGKVRSGGNITGAKGTMTMESIKSCAGWTVKQQMKLSVIDNEGTRVETDTNLSTFESLDGRKFRFTVRNTRDGRLVESLSGNASIAADGSGTATFTEPKGKRFDLPKGTIFPTEHTLQLIQEASKNKRIVFRRVFDGASADGPVEVNAIVGKPLAKAPKRWAKEPLMQGTSWYVRLAFFVMSRTTAEPDYELGVRLFANGIADDFSLDYPNFTVNARLGKFEVIEAPKC